LRRATTANDTSSVTGRERTAAWNTTTTGIATTKEIMAGIATTTVITTTIAIEAIARCLVLILILNFRVPHPSRRRRRVGCL
jgi:hypothetical protein